MAISELINQNQCFYIYNKTKIMNDTGSSGLSSVSCNIY